MYTKEQMAIMPQNELLALALKMKQCTQQEHDSMLVIISSIFEMSIRAFIIERILKRQTELVSENYQKIEAFVKEGKIDKAVKLCNESGITRIAFNVSENGLSIIQGIREMTKEKNERKSGYTITNGEKSYTSLAQMSKELTEKTGINGMSMINALKKVTTLGDWSVIDKDGISHNFVIWAKQNIANCPDI